MQCLMSTGKAAVKEKEVMGIKRRARDREVAESLLFPTRSPTSHSRCLGSLYVSLKSVDQHNCRCLALPVKVNRGLLNNRLVKEQVVSVPRLSQLEANEHSQYCLGSGLTCL